MEERAYSGDTEIFDGWDVVAWLEIGMSDTGRSVDLLTSQIELALFDGIEAR